MKVFSLYIEAFLPPLAVLLAALGFIFGATVVAFVGSAVFVFVVCAVLFAFAAPIIGGALALLYWVFLCAAAPFYSLYAVLRKIHRAS
jgi:hypothetical protein